MNITKKLFLLSSLGLSFLITGCVATQDDVGGLYSRQSRIEAKVDRLTKQLASVSSAQPATGPTVDYGEQIFQLENKIFQLEQSINGLNDKIIALSNARAQQQSRPTPVRENSYKQPEITTPEPEEIVEPERSDFDVGYSDLARGDYASARESFESYIENNSKGEKVPEAIFLIADSYYREGLYEEAILEYQTLIDRFPGNSRVPLSYLKQGLSLIKIDRIEEAKLFMESLIDKYPDSQEAAEARNKLSQLEETG